MNRDFVLHLSLPGQIANRTFEAAQPAVHYFGEKYG